MATETLTDPALPTSDGGQGEDTRHGVCLRCSPGTKPGDLVIALCGLEVRLKPDAQVYRANTCNLPDACSMCRDMEKVHVEQHRKGLS